MKDFYANVKDLNEVIEDDVLIPSSSPLGLVMNTIKQSYSDIQGAINSQLALNNPSLATNREELLTHLIDGEEEYLLSTPSTTTFTLRMSVSEIINNGIINNDTGDITFSIPKDSQIIVDNIYFTLLYDVHVKLVKNEVYTPFIDYGINEDTLIFGSTGIAPSTIYVDGSDNEWLLFTVEVAQVKVSQYLTNAIKGVDFEVTLDYEDQWFYSLVEHKLPDGTWEKITKHYNESIFDLDNPSIYCSIQDSKVVYKIPDTFLDNDELTGNIRFTIYSTLGKLKVNMKNFVAKDFSFVVNKNSVDKEYAVTRNMTIVPSNTSVIDGGTLPTLFKDIKKRIINRTTSRISNANTRPQIFEAIRRTGMKGYLVSDTLFDRVYLAKQEVNLKVEEVFPYVYQNDIVIALLEDSLSTLQSNVTYNKDFIIFSPGLKIKQVNGSLKLLDKMEEDYLNSLGLNKRIEYITSNNLQETMFTYIIDNEEDETITRVYDKNPVVSNFRLQTKNKASDVKVNISTVDFESVDEETIKIKIKLIGNDKYDNNKTKMKIQLSLQTISGTVFYTALYNQLEDTYETIVKYSKYITKDDHLVVTNGLSNSPSREVDINGTINVIIYSEDQNIISTQNQTSLAYLGDNEIYNPNVTITNVGFTKQIINYSLFKRLDRLWSQTFISAITPVVKRHEVDIPLRYLEDVYEADPTTGCAFNIIDDDNDGVCDRLERTKLFSKGDIVYANDEIVYEHRIGDIVYEDGQPVKLDRNEYTMLTNLLTISSLYTTTNNQQHLYFRSLAKDLITTNILDKLYSVTSIINDNTKIFYKSKHSLGKYKTVDGVEYDSLTKPSVTIYYDKDKTYNKITGYELNLLVGNVVRRYASKSYFTVNQIERELENTLSGVASIDITNFTIDNRRLLSCDGDNFFSLKITTDSLNRLQYDIDIKIIDI